MKRYFAKYFPKVGGFNRSVKDANGVPYDFEQEVELCLCEHEIKVGGEARWGTLKTNKPNWKKITEVGDDYIRIEGDPDMLDVSSCSFKDFIKVGFISENATWVKEDHEFSEHEVRITKRCALGDGCKYLGHDEDYGKCKGTWQMAELCEHRNVNYCLIKGPCGHFH